jgi:pimeloyl-ACP methyl ester carboxylesterase
MMACGSAACAAAGPREPTPIPSPLQDKPFSEPPRHDEAPATPAPTRAELDVPGHAKAVLSLPAASLGAKPLLVVAHGAGDRPEWQCDWWAGALGNRAVVLCLRGSAMYPRRADTGYYFRHHHALEDEALAALDALEREHAPRLAPGPAVYVGFSQGAIMGALFVAKHPERFRRVILIEGGYDEWDVPTSRRFAAGGGARVLFACGQSYCASHARASMRWLGIGGVNARLELAPGAGHTYAGDVGERVLAAFAWVVDGDPRWR